MNNSRLPNTPQRSGLHARAIEALLDLLERDRGHRPDLQTVAAHLDVSNDALEQIFPDPQTLLDAAAEESLMRLVDMGIKSVVAADPNDHVGQFSALGSAYIDWAVQYRDYFRMTTDRLMVDPCQNTTLGRYHWAMRDVMAQILVRARENGQIAADTDIELLLLSARALIYGMARMVVDGHMPEWHPTDDPVHEVKRALAQFIEMVALGVQPAGAGTAPPDAG